MLRISNSRMTEAVMFQRSLLILAGNEDHSCAGKTADAIRQEADRLVETSRTDTLHSGLHTITFPFIITRNIAFSYLSYRFLVICLTTLMLIADVTFSWRKAENAFCRQH